MISDNADGNERQFHSEAHWRPPNCAISRRELLAMAMIGAGGLLIAGCGGGGQSSASGSAGALQTRTQPTGDLRNQVSQHAQAVADVFSSWSGPSQIVEDAADGYAQVTGQARSGRAVDPAVSCAQLVYYGITTTAVTYERQCNFVLRVDNVGYLGDTITLTNKLQGASNISNPQWTAAVFEQALYDLQMLGELHSVFQSLGVFELMDQVLQESDFTNQRVQYGLFAYQFNNWVTAVAGRAQTALDPAWLLDLTSPTSAGQVTSALTRVPDIVDLLPFGPGYRPGSPTTLKDDDASLLDIPGLLRATFIGQHAVLFEGVSDLQAWFKNPTFGPYTRAAASRANPEGPDPLSAIENGVNALRGKDGWADLAVKTILDLWGKALEKAQPGLGGALACVVKTFLGAGAAKAASTALLAEGATAELYLVPGIGEIKGFLDAAAVLLGLANTIKDTTDWIKLPKKSPNKLKNASGKRQKSGKFRKVPVKHPIHDQVGFGHSKDPIAFPNIQQAISDFENGPNNPFKNFPTNNILNQLNGLSPSGRSVRIGSRAAMGSPRTFLLIEAATLTFIHDLARRNPDFLEPVLTQDSFQFTRYDFAYLLRRDFPDGQAPIPDISQADLLCTGIGFTPQRGTNVDLSEATTLPDLMNLSALSPGVNFNVN